MDYHWLTRKCDGDCENCDPGACKQDIAPTVNAEGTVAKGPGPDRKDGAA